MMPEITRKLGIYGKAFDSAGTKRAYTYSAHQPDNSGAWGLGLALMAVRGDHSGEGDPIDAGLKLLKHLEQAGFGVFEMDTTGGGDTGKGADHA
jgi:hypothetical protein